jgi:hypothetical protein
MAFGCSLPSLEVPAAVIEDRSFVTPTRCSRGPDRDG